MCEVQSFWVSSLLDFTAGERKPVKDRIAVLTKHASCCDFIPKEPIRRGIANQYMNQQGTKALSVTDQIQIAIRICIGRPKKDILNFVLNQPLILSP